MDGSTCTLKSRIFGTQLAHFSFPVCNKRGPFAHYEPELTRSSCSPDNLFSYPFSLYFLFFYFVFYPRLYCPSPTYRITVTRNVLVFSTSAARRNIHSPHVSPNLATRIPCATSPPSEISHRAPNDASVRAHNRLTDMELPNVAVSNTGPCVIILRGELVGPSKQRLSPCHPLPLPAPNPCPTNRALVPPSVKG